VRLFPVLALCRFGFTEIAPDPDKDLFASVRRRWARTSGRREPLCLVPNGRRASAPALFESRYGSALPVRPLGSRSALRGLARNRHRNEYNWIPIMNMNLVLGPLVSLIAGILILVMPRLLNYIVAIYLIIIGLIGLFGTGGFHLTR
jgi:hypothetical protein